MKIKRKKYFKLLKQVTLQTHYATGNYSNMLSLMTSEINGNLQKIEELKLEYKLVYK